MRRGAAAQSNPGAAAGAFAVKFLTVGPEVATTVLLPTRPVIACTPLAAMGTPIDHLVLGDPLQQRAAGARRGRSRRSPGPCVGCGSPRRALLGRVPPSRGHSRCPPLPASCCPERRVRTGRAARTRSARSSPRRPRPSSCGRGHQ